MSVKDEIIKVETQLKELDEKSQNVDVTSEEYGKMLFKEVALLEMLQEFYNKNNR